MVISIFKVAQVKKVQHLVSVVVEKPNIDREKTKNMNSFFACSTQLQLRREPYSGFLVMFMCFI